MSFFFKVIPYMTALWIGILYVPGMDSGTKFALVRFSAWIFLGLCSMIALFAFLRPRHLVYGELGHRAERKMEFGSEKRTYTDLELESLEPERNTKQIEAGIQPENL